MLGIQNGLAPRKTVGAIYPKTIHAATTQASNYIARHHFQKYDEVSSRRNPNMNVYNCFILGSQNWKPAKCRPLGE